MKSVKVQGTVFFHIFPKHDVDEAGVKFIHDVTNGADCECEPQCLAEFHPTKPNVPFYIIIHRQDKIACTTVSLINYKPPPPEDTPPGPTSETPWPKWSR